MKCKKIQPFLPTLAANRLESSEARMVQEHLADCGDCKQSFEKSQKIHALIGLKRHEQPDEFFLRQFVPEVQRRLYSEMARKPSWRAALRRVFFLDVSPIPWFFRAASGVSLILILGGLMLHLPMGKTGVKFSAKQNASTMTASSMDSEARFNHLVLAENQSSRSSVYVLDRVNDQHFNHGPVVLDF